MKSDQFVSVIMPAFNAGKYIAEAIQSILNQSHSNFELLIVDDGSQDNTLSIIKSFNDSRIRLFPFEKNSGNRIAVNYLLEKASGKYIFRMDADDISNLKRLEKQIDFMEKNPTIGFSGSHIKLFGDESSVWKFPTDKDEIKLTVLFGAIVVQGVSVIRKEILDRFNLRYESNGLNYAEDISFFYKLFKVSEAGNINEILLNYRKHDTNVTKTIGVDAFKLNRDVFKVILFDFGLEPNDSEMKTHFWLNSRFTDEMESKDIQLVYQWKEKLKFKNKEVAKTSPIYFDSYIEDKWNRLFYFCCDKGYVFYNEYKKCQRISFSQKLYFYKSILKSKIHG